jgi:chromosome segregation ATPase
MRISAATRTKNENRIRAAIDRLLRGEIPPGANCDIKTLAHEAGVDRTAFYGNRPYAHLRTEFEDRLQRLRDAGTTPDPKIAQVDRLKADNAKLKERLVEAEQTITGLEDFRKQALARLAAQHEEIVRLRNVADATARVVRLPTTRAQAQAIGPC